MSIEISRDDLETILFFLPRGVLELEAEYYAYRFADGIPPNENIVSKIAKAKELCRILELKELGMDVYQSHSDQWKPFPTQGKNTDE